MKTSYLLLALLIFSSSKIIAQWDGNSSTLNNLVTTASNGSAITVSDKYGGAIRVWENNKSIFIQRKTVGGIVGWNDVTNPVMLFQDAASNAVGIADMIVDGDGGVYISWVNHVTATTADLYLQHIGSNGQKSWNANGIKINPAGAVVCTEGKLCLSNDGVMIVWGTEKLDPTVPSPDSNRLYIQKYNLDGIVSWPAAATPVSIAAGLKFWPVLAADSSNGIYVSFTDTRNSARAPDGTYNNFDLFMQHFSPDGQRLWSDSDVVISNQPFHQTSYNDYAPTSVGNRPSMLTDDLGNVIILYENNMDDFFPDNEFLEAQRLNFSGAHMWSNAVKADVLRGNKIYLQSAPDGNNGLVMCWKNIQGAATVYAQRITSAGTLPWNSNAIAINSPIENDFFYQTSAWLPMMQANML